MLRREAMSLKEESYNISKRLVQKREDNEKEIAESKKKLEQYEDEFLTASAHGDASENAQLDAAKQNLRQTTGDLNRYLDIARRLSKIEDPVFLREVYKDRKDDYPEYLPCGVVKTYSTVVVGISIGTAQSEDFTVKLYPSGISFVEDRIIAVDSVIGKAILGKRVGDTGSTVTSGNKTVTYEIKDLY